jgi:hypothetical protein
MSSFIWGRDPEEAYANPFEYEAQEQFIREARSLLEKLSEALNPRQLRFQKDERTMQKAIWMLQVDALESLREALELIGERRHRPAARLFRDAIETMDLAAYFRSRTPESNRHLEQWYGDEVIQHRVTRDFLQRTEGVDVAHARRAYYASLSKFTHRTYRVLLKSYSLGRDDYMVSEDWSKHGLLVLPQTIAAYLAILADLISEFSNALKKSGLVSEAVLEVTWTESLEPYTTRRKFMPVCEVIAPQPSTAGDAPKAA